MSSIPWLDDSLEFPPSSDALSEPNGLLAVGGDLSQERLLAAYSKGIFPWFDSSQPILWWSPSPRAVLYPEHIHISRSLKKAMSKSAFKLTLDRAFPEVIKHCAHTPRPGQAGTWINNDMVMAYQKLHVAGHAHSLEVWDGELLVGGLYGICIGRVFFGESMFSHRRDCSKMAFVALARQLLAWGFAIIDCQVSNPHLFSLGAEEIEREDFEAIIASNVHVEGQVDWKLDWQSPQELSH